MRCAQLVIGPAGSGKSTYCSAFLNHAMSCRRVVEVVNLDPAAEHFTYPCSVDIRQLIELSDVLTDKELKLGPNGGLIFCMEFLINRLDWLKEQIDIDFSDDRYILFDCPGQIELYTHHPVMRRLVDTLQQWDFRVVSAFILDTQFLLDASKMLSGTLIALSTMVTLETSHVNILTKMDLLSKKNRELVESFLEPEFNMLLEEEMNEDSTRNRRLSKLNKALAGLLEDYSLIRFLPLDITDEDSMNDIFIAIDNIVGYSDDAEVKDLFPEDVDMNGFV